MVEATNFPIISKGIYNTNAEYKLHVDGADLLEFLVYDEDVDNCFQGVKYTTALAQNKWIHVVATSGATTESGTAVRGTMKLYVDGVQVNNDTSGSGAASYDAMVNGAANMHIGRYDSTYANGKIRDVKIYDYELSSDQVSSLYSNTSPQTAKHVWKMDEGTGGTANDTGTGTALDITSFSGNAALGDNNGTLDLDGTLTIDATGTLSMPRGDLRMSAAGVSNTFDINCTNVDPTSAENQFIHNDGRFQTDAAGDFQLYANGAAFYKIITNCSSSGNLELHESMTIEKEVVNGSGDPIQLTGGQTYTFGTDTQSADINEILRASNGSGTVTVQGASSLLPVNISQYDDMARDLNLNLANVNVTTSVVHNRNTTITLTGDCEFDDVRINSGATLDLNGQRAEFSGGLFNNTGTLTDGGDNSLIHITGTSALRSYTGDSSTQWSFGHHNDDPNMTLGNTDMIISGGAASIKMPSTANDFARTVLVSGSGTQTINSGVGFCPQNLIAGSEITTHGSHNNKIDTTNLTIPTGGTLTANASTLTVAGDFTTSGGLIGKSALNLTGSEEVTGSDNLDEVATTNKFTIEAWFRASTDANYRAIFSRGTSWATGNLYVYMNSDGNVQASSNDLGNTLTSTTNGLADSKWHHVAYTYDTTTIKLYIDGKLEATSASTSGINTQSNGFKIGDRSGDNWVGQIGRVSVWKNALTEGQIRNMLFMDWTTMAADNYDGSSNPNGFTDSDAIGWWQFDEGKDVGVEDLSSQSNDGTLNSAAWAGSGTFDDGTSTLVMAKSSGTQTITAHSQFTFYNLTVNSGSTTQMVGVADSGAPFIPTHNVNIQGTLTSASCPIYNGNAFVSNGGAYTFGTAGTSVAGVASFRHVHTSGTIDFPACTTKFLRCEASGGTTRATGDLTLTTELQVDNGATFNANGNTIGYKALDINGTLDLRNSTAQSIDANSDYIDFTGGILLSGNSTLQGYATGSNRTEFKAPAIQNLELVGTAKFLDVFADSDLTVIGAVIDCDASASGANIRQWHHTLDTQQLLDADENGDDDLRLTKPALDNALELMTK
jgi:hypothetical protein